MRVEELMSEGRFPPTWHDMPELDEACDDTLFLRLCFAICFEDEEWLTPEQKRTLTNHARLTDKAVREYKAARECLVAFVAADGSEASTNRTPDGVSVVALQQHMRAGDHLENCVSAVKRAGRFWYHAVEDAGFDPAIFDELFVPLKELREKIEHGDKDFFGEGEPLFITVLPESVYLNGTELLYLELKALIELLHLNASVLINSADGIPKSTTRS